MRSSVIRRALFIALMRVANALEGLKLAEFLATARY
jgi:hypothetical protein